MQATEDVRDDIHDDKVDNIEIAHEVWDSGTRADLVNIFDWEVRDKLYFEPLGWELRNKLQRLIISIFNHIYWQISIDKLMIIHEIFFCNKEMKNIGTFSDKENISKLFHL